MLTEIIQVLWLFLPAALANMFAAIIKIPFLYKPINKKWFGSHKTYNGFIIGIIVAIIVLYLQTKVLLPYEYLVLNYYLVNVLLVGFLMGGGALTGDLVASFFKRKFRIRPGKPWLIVDQIDWVIGATVFLLPIVILPILSYVYAAVLLGILTFLGQLIGYAAGVKEKEI